jgi:hypothetical protein
MKKHIYYKESGLTLCGITGSNPDGEMCSQCHHLATMLLIGKIDRQALFELLNKKSLDIESSCI